jgi:hypothetical protein
LDFLNRYHPGVDPSIQLIQMNGTDVQRSAVVSHILALYNSKSKTVKRPRKNNIVKLIDSNNTFPNDVPLSNVSKMIEIKELRKIDLDCAMIPNDPFLRKL